MPMQLGTMPLLNDYSLCQQAVTVYHNDGTTITRTVWEKAFLDHRKTETVDRTGSAESNGFLLVIPSAEQACHVGDKVFDGVGPFVPGTQTTSTTTTTTTTTSETVSTATATTTTTGDQTPSQDALAWWRAFIPSKVDGLVVVKYVDVKRWAGSIVHTEAGG